MSKLAIVKAAPTMYEALSLVLSWLTNVNVCEPSELAAKVIEALRAAGMDERDLDAAAIAMMKGAAHRWNSYLT